MLINSLNKYIPHPSRLQKLCANKALEHEPRKTVAHTPDSYLA